MKNIFKKIFKGIEYIFLLLRRFTLNIFNVFPVHKNRILFFSYSGKQYSCNPKVLSDYLIENNYKYEIIWAFENPKKMLLLVEPSIKCINIHSVSFAYYHKTAKVIVCNCRETGILSKRKGQFIFQTWHASCGYKQIVPQKGIPAKINRLVCKDYSYVNSGCEIMTKYRVNGTFGYDGNIILGTPRIDLLLSCSQRKKNDIFARVYQYFNIDKKTHIVLFAPTYRSSKSVDFGMDFSRLISILKKRFGGEWVVLSRMHYFIKNKQQTHESVLDASTYPDIFDLLIFSDILVSDYSSCIWDFTFLNKPCFLFCSDLHDYELQPGLILPVSKWNIPYATNMNELESTIMESDETTFLSNIQKHHKLMGSFEDGNATKRTINIIVNCLEGLVND